jgi:hypothetical protein
MGFELNLVLLMQKVIRRIAAGFLLAYLLLVESYQIRHVGG